MATKRRFFWIKLKKDFFSQKEIKKLRRIAGGDTYTIIYLKMLLKSIDNEGKLYYEGIEDNFINELALDIDEDIENVQITVLFLQKQGLLVTCDDLEYDLPEAQENIGSEGASAERVRNYRNRVKALQCNTTVTDVKQVGNVEIEKEIEIEKDINILSGKPDDMAVIDVKKEEKEKQHSNDMAEFRHLCIDYLNQKLGTSYKTDNNKTIKLLNARYNEGIRFNDVQSAIDKKVKDWRGTKMQKYLRPETLFSNKLEGYINELEGGECASDRKNNKRAEWKQWQRNDWEHEPAGL